MNFELLLKQLGIKVVTSESENYDEARAVYNGMIDIRPAAIVYCKSKTDVVQAVNFAKTNNIEVSIRSGGHNGAGLALVQDGMVIDLSEMNHIQIDSNKQTAVIEPGCLLRDVDAATHEYGLALPSGIIGSTGIAGLTLGGGLGYLSRKAGLTIDHLLECELVLANGEIVITNKDSNPDLFWALRGGGGNFGIVTSFKFNLIGVKNVYAGPMFWPIEMAEEVMKFYDQITQKASNDLYGFFAFLNVPPGPPFPEHLWGQNVCGVVWNYTGPKEMAKEVFQPIRAFGPPILDFVGEMPFPVLNSMFDAALPPGLQWYWKAHYFKELNLEAIKVHVKHGSNLATMLCTTHLYPIDGACNEISNEETAWSNRDVRWAQVIIGVDPDAANSDKVTQWAKDYYNDLIPHAMGGAYVNFMMNEDQKRVKDSYKGNYDRLAKIKREYDPTNFFHINQNIKPASNS